MCFPTNQSNRKPKVKFRVLLSDAPGMNLPSPVLQISNTMKLKVMLCYKQLSLCSKEKKNQPRTFFICEWFQCKVAGFTQLTFLPNIDVETELSKDSCGSGDRRSCYTRCKVSLGFHVTIFSHYLNKNYIEVVQVPGNKDFPWC